MQLHLASILILLPIILAAALPNPQDLDSIVDDLGLGNALGDSLLDGLTR